ncbi:UDP-N-acetylmuramyl pentapeptide phosphotransferase/UDP-N-acetylglucosamine-1-phosphate transferase [Lysobacter ruishenii]|uniref:UDP-N-acetylmuramyl pentapeptide phosphotransferase/UDP-N-acetylglucosamine-1-phosphate transferase n=2 Tax=Aerolutibacter ruishenii TaxID=686800 RepID=A0A562LVH7_9GAMM|nr:UDP-N-acetylmuramyl pentapeptide phosphotransferase/UDP-N-acetylglucosamine-1-phosphate transferase [Lysobacter ruishenii]
MAAWLIGTIGTALAIRYAQARAMLDQPGERRSHQVPTPRGGGVAIVVAALVVGIGQLMSQWGHVGGQSGLVLAFLAGFGLVAAIGWADDHRPLPASVRLLMQVLAAGVFAGALWIETRHMGLALLAFVAPVVLANVWNFMDGINGIAATQAVVVAAFLSLALPGLWMVLALAIAAATWAFVPFNFPRAQVFMGDVGSGAIGFALGCLIAVAVARGLETTPARASVWLLALPLSAFLVDATLTLAGRILRGERWWTPHVLHAYQGAARVVGHGKVTMGFLAWTLLACAVALTAWSHSDIFVLATVASWYTLGAVLWFLLQRWARVHQSVVRSGNGA